MTGFAPEDAQGRLLDPPKIGVPRSLRERFLIPPYSTLDRRSGYWQERRQGWLSLGIRSELGRNENLLNFSDRVRGHTSDSALRSGAYKARYDDKGWHHLDDAAQGKARYDGREQEAAEMKTGAYYSGTSVFDPVVCELAYRWFCKPGGRVLDPFAGGSVRGIVAALCGLGYLGVDLSQDQIEANQQQVRDILGPEGMARALGADGVAASEPPPQPQYIVGDAMDLPHHVAQAGLLPDLIFTCPPYGDLEVYSDDPRDLSTMSYAQFRAGLAYVIAASVAVLKANSFAAIVVSDIRDRDGCYRGLVADTIEAFEAAGARLYNQAIIIDPTGSAAIRARTIFDSARKFVPCHQHLLVFIKGDAKAAAAPIIAAAKAAHDEQPEPQPPEPVPDPDPEPEPDEEEEPEQEPEPALVPAVAAAEPDLAPRSRGTEHGRCRRCAEPLLRAQTERGMPVILDAEPNPEEGEWELFHDGVCARWGGISLSVARADGKRLYKRHQHGGTG